MDMSLETMQAAAEALRAAGFSVTNDLSDVESASGDIAYVRHRFAAEREPDERLTLDCLAYPDGREGYWLELERIGSLRALPFELHSWRCHPDRIEFRFYARPDGVALTFDLLL